MECPNCTATLPDDDIFCEECGVRLVEEPTPDPVPGGCACGAGPDEVDEDGFCTRCGKRVRPRAEDHIEIVISPDFAAVADRGIRHDRNEDRVALCGTGAFACAEPDKDAQAVRPVPHQILVVCDGVSSSSDAQTAAAAAVAAISEALSQDKTIEAAFAEAAARVSELDRSGDAPSTTAVAARVNDRVAEIAWVGDSRAYWIDSHGAKQLTHDHSWLNDVVSAGEMSYDEAAADSKAHAITRWLGGDSGENAQPEILRFDIPGPGSLLLCTDGLWNYAPSEADMANLFNAAACDAIEVCRRLIDFAKEQGGLDNITAALLRFQPTEQN